MIIAPPIPVFKLGQVKALLPLTRLEQSAEKLAYPFRDGPSGPGPESMNIGQAIDFAGPCFWLPGSRAEPAPRNDDVPAFSAAC